MNSQSDIRLEIFRDQMAWRVTATLIAEAGGVLSGVGRACAVVEGFGAEFHSDLADGNAFETGQELIRATGDPFQMARVEEQVIGTLAKTSGIATAARHARQLAGSDLQVVSGGWKKMPAAIKDMVRQAAWDGGIRARMCDEPFIYLDKNYVRVFGDPSSAVRAVASLGKAVVVQVRGESAPIGEEAVRAARAGGSVIMVDTGEPTHLRTVSEALKTQGLRELVRLAFGGNVKLEHLAELRQIDLDSVDIGAAILDAPLLPMRFDVVQVHKGE